MLSAREATVVKVKRRSSLGRSISALMPRVLRSSSTTLSQCILIMRATTWSPLSPRVRAGSALSHGAANFVFCSTMSSPRCVWRGWMGCFGGVVYEHRPRYPADKDITLVWPWCKNGKFTSLVVTMQEMRVSET